jgi:hypothetical protein
MVGLIVVKSSEGFTSPKRQRGHSQPRWHFGLVKKKQYAPRKQWRWFLVLILGGYLLFCHGCHADEDNELRAATNMAANQL